MDIQESEKLRFSDKQILVVGEGDFSFSLSLAKAFGPAINITATSLDIREELGRNYNNGKANVEELERLGCTVVRGVSVHSITSDNRLARYDVILFHFPHAGKHHGVLGGFMESAKEMLKEEDGEIHIIRNICPFNKWDIKALAEEEGLRLIKQMKFDKWDFPGYPSKRGSICDYGFPYISAVTFIFKK